MSTQNRFNELDLSLFCYQFSVVLKSGIPYLEAIGLIADEALDSKLKPYMEDIAQAVKSGTSLYQAISDQNAFPMYMTEMIHIAEKTGNLGETFERLSTYYDNRHQLRQKLRGALTYPLILIGLMTAVILLLVTKVLPIFHDILKSVGGEIPSATKWILSFGQVLQNGIVGLMLVLVLFILGMLILLKTDLAKGIKDSALMSLPMVKPLYHKASIVRFSKALSMLIHSGMDLRQALKMVGPLMDNHRWSEHLESVEKNIQTEMSFHEALAKTGLFPELFVKMIRIGERSGALDKTLDKVSEIYDSELNRSLHKLTVSLEPTLVIILSVIVGAIMLTVMLPLINIMSSIG